MKSIELVVGKGSPCEPTYGQLQDLAERLNAADPALAERYEVYVLYASIVGLDDHEIVARIFTDSADEVKTIAGVLCTLSFPDGPVPLIHFQHVPLSGTFSKLGSKR